MNRRGKGHTSRNLGPLYCLSDIYNTQSSSELKSHIVRFKKDKKYKFLVPSIWTKLTKIKIKFSAGMVKFFFKAFKRPLKCGGFEVLI